MKIVIQCAGDKQPDAGSFEFRGKPVKFVSRPQLAEREASTEFYYFKPDDVNPDASKSWRQLLVEYNNAGDNSRTLLPAVDLYLDSTYHLAGEYAAQTASELYILSAGWGLVSGNFWLPSYNITFTRQKNVPKYALRAKKDEFKDLNHLRTIGPDEEIHFFGGQKYVPLFCALTAALKSRKIVHHLHSVRPAQHRGFEYAPFTPASPKRRTNWHYECLQRFIAADRVEQ